MRNNDRTYYHTSIAINEYPFDKVYVDNVSKELKETINRFNNSGDINEKTILTNNIPIDFPICRFCGNKIINSNFKIKYTNKYLQIISPSVYCREIDGHKYYLSCCKNCLLDHFKENPPKSEKYYFMKANIYGQYSFGYSYDEYKKICSMTVGVTYDSMIRKYGIEEGNIKWNEYCNKQAIKNTFEHKKKKFGWTKTKFKEFNKTRAVTLENLVNKYGEYEGLVRWKDYCEKQSYTKSFEYMVNKFGYDKTIEINKSKGLTLENFIRKYGEELGNKKYVQYCHRHINFYSKISQKLFDEFDKYLGEKYTTYYATKNHEYFIKLNDVYVCLDYYIKELNICIEFNGTIYHGDPRVFKDNDKCNPHSEKTCKQIHEEDELRYKLLKDTYNIDTYVIWQMDYNENFDIKYYIDNILKIEL